MKNFLIFLLIILFEVIGNACLSHGMRLVGDVSVIGLPSLGIIAAGLLTNPWIIVGVGLLIGYFLSFLTALSRLELSYVLPMTASGYVLTTLIAWRLLGESISASRWWGTVLVCMGVTFVGLSERKKSVGLGSGAVQ